MRIQFDLSEEDGERLIRQIGDEKVRHTFGRLALLEWINRKEARDSRAADQKVERLKKEISPIIKEVLQELRVI